MTSPDQANELLNLYYGMFFGGDSCGPTVPDPLPTTDPRAKGNALFDLVQHIRKTTDQTALDAHAAANRPTTVTLTDADRTAIVADLATALGGQVATLNNSVQELITAIRAGAQAQTAALPQG